MGRESVTTSRTLRFVASTAIGLALLVAGIGTTSGDAKVAGASSPALTPIQAKAAIVRAIVNKDKYRSKWIPKKLDYIKRLNMVSIRKGGRQATVRGRQDTEFSGTMFMFVDMASLGLVREVYSQPTAGRPRGHYGQNIGGYPKTTYLPELAVLAGRAAQATGLSSSRFGKPRGLSAIRADGWSKLVATFAPPRSTGAAAQRSVRRVDIGRRGAVSKISFFR